jgi:hypothetical protein
MLLFEGESRVVKYIFNNMTPEDFSTPVFQNLAEVVFEAFTSGEDIIPGALVDKIDDPESKQYVLKISIDKHPISKTWESINPGLPSSQNMMKYAKDSIKKLRLFRIDKELEIKHHLIETTNDEEEIIKLMKEHNHLLSERKLLDI